MTAARPQLVIGTAGHIDHGKSRLVRTLTGVDPDRLPEEQTRGMTIDLGFAHLPLDAGDVWFVDVPGHERFIRNMVAGATGVDAALLVVAADDSVMPQTREHIEVLALLSVREVIVAITKCDLVDNDWAALVGQDVAQLLREWGITPRAAIACSAEDGRGIDELRGALAAMLADRRNLADAGGPAWFRMPIDRAFQVAGRGVVVTGSVMHGTVAAGDELELWPAGRRVRVRGLQTHHDATESTTGRLRLALNIVGDAARTAQRGCDLATSGYLTPSTRLEVRLERLRMRRGRRRIARLRVHLGTAEVHASLLLPEPAEETVVVDAFALLRPEKPVVATAGQRLILRDDSGQRTLGGGAVTRPCLRDGAWVALSDRARFEAAQAASADQRVVAVLREAEFDVRTPAQIAAFARLRDADEAERILADLMRDARVLEFTTANERLFVACETFDTLSKLLAKRLDVIFQRGQATAGVPKHEWLEWMPNACPASFRSALANALAEEPPFTILGDFVTFAVRVGDALSAEDEPRYRAILKILETGAFQPPTGLDAYATAAGRAAKAQELLAYGCDIRTIVRLADGVWLHHDFYQTAVARILQTIDEEGGLTAARVRDLLGSTRKFVVPLLEHLDARNITRRVSDRRVRGSATKAGDRER